MKTTDKSIKLEDEEKIDSSDKREEHPAFKHVQELLWDNDFSRNYINNMLEKMRKEFPLKKLDDPYTVQEHILEWIGETISIYKEDAVTRKPRIMVLVGPPGVGKTKTIASLAAHYGIENDIKNIPTVKVRMITIDFYHIEAKYHFKTLGEILNIPVSHADSNLLLRKNIAMYSEDTDIFLIDTIGKSAGDKLKLSEMKEILDGAGKEAEYYLVISASAKATVIEDVMRQFESFNYKSVIITKMDETDRIGNVISALAEKRKSVSYITDTQEILMGIKKASMAHFLINLKGFEKNREEIEKRFPL